MGKENIFGKIMKFMMEIFRMIRGRVWEVTFGPMEDILGVSGRQIE